MSHFLEYKPSQLAAASLLAAINISLSDVAPKIGIKLVESLAVDPTNHMESPKDKDPSLNNPLHIWTTSIEELTSLS